MDFNDWWLRHLLWNCPNLNVTGLYWWSVNFGSGNGLVPSGNKPLPEPMLTKSLGLHRLATKLTCLIPWMLHHRISIFACCVGWMVKLNMSMVSGKQLSHHIWTTAGVTPLLKHWIPSYLDMVLLWFVLLSSLVPEKSGCNSKMQFSILIYCLPSGEFHCSLLMIGQHWFRWWLGVVRQQAVIWSYVH